MLSQDVERYIDLQRTVGFKFGDQSSSLRLFAAYAMSNGDEFVRVSTNVQKADGSRAIGTLLDPKGKVIEAIAQDKSYFGEANILGKDYVTGYEPIHNASNNIIGIYYVGYLK